MEAGRDAGELAEGHARQQRAGRGGGAGDQPLRLVAQLPHLPHQLRVGQVQAGAGGQRRGARPQRPHRGLDAGDIFSWTVYVTVNPHNQ